MQKRNDLIWATLGEAGLLLVAAGIGWAISQPLVFASLGPTAYELVEQPQLRSARIYNVIVGHMTALGCGFLSIFVLNAWRAPGIITSHTISAERIWTVTIAAALTTIVTLILKASQPAALSTTLLVSTGAMQTGPDAVAIIAGVLIITALGEPIRRFRLKHTNLRPVTSGHR